MALVVNTNIASLNAQRNLGISNSQLGKSLEKLSSGLRINKAADDAAGLAIATKFSAQVKGLNQAVRNANNAISLVQTAEGGVNTLTNVLQRLRELAVQSSSDDNTATDRATLTSEASNLITEFTRIANTTEFNTMALMDGTFSGRYFQVGANYAQQVTFNIGDARGKSLGGRAESSADIADGVLNASNANFGAGEFKVNTYDVAATNAADDQYSVVDLSSKQLSNILVSQLANAVSGLASATSIASNAAASYLSLTLKFTVNSITVSVQYSISANSATNDTSEHWSNAQGTVVNGSTLAADIVSAINNNASLAALDITARQVNTSGWMVERTGGGNLTVLASMQWGTAQGDLATSYVSAVNTSTYYGTIGMASLISNVTSVIADGFVHTTTTAPTAYNGESSAIAKAVAINTIKSLTQVTATAQKNEVTGSSAIGAGTLTSGDVYINGVNIGDVTVTASDSTGALVTAINNQSTETGVVASKDSSGKLVLTASDGRNITVTVNESTDATSILGLSSSYFVGTTAVFRSTVKLNSESNIALTGTLSDLYDETDDMTKTDNTSVSAATDLATYNVAALEIDTQENAQAAILTIDAALNDLNSLRSQIGAIQNRIEFTVSNLETASENMAASESRIRDADFAFETARFTRNQIMVQAGTAMLAQANTLQQVALQLLK